MGKKENTDSKPFLEDDITNKSLIIDMLKYEDTIYLGPIGKEIYGDSLYKPRISLTPEFTIHRIVLDKFGFDTSDESVQNYRKIFGHYYKSGTDYDNEVLSSVAYMRENKCLYYTRPIISKSDIIPDCKIFNLAKKEETLYKVLGNDFEYAFVAGYSSS
jgi:hypothetical protein